MAIPPEWSAQKLAEFLTAVSSFTTEAAAALGAVERVAESLDAEVAAIVSRGELVAAIGYPEGEALVAEIARSLGCPRELTVPGAGLCSATVVPLEHPPGGPVVARSGPDALSRDEVGLLQGMARVTSMTLRMLRLLDDERALRKESQRQGAENARLLATLTEHQERLKQLADEQAALRRVATLVASQPPAERVLATVTEEVGRLLRVGITQMLVYAGDGTATAVAGWIDPSVRGQQIPVGTRLALEGDNLAGHVYRTQRSTRMNSDSPATVRSPSTSTMWLHSAAASRSSRRPRSGGVIAAPCCGPAGGNGAAHRGVHAPDRHGISNAEARRTWNDSWRSRPLRRVATLVRRGCIGRDLHSSIQRSLGSRTSAPKSCALQLTQRPSSQARSGDTQAGGELEVVARRRQLTARVFRPSSDQLDGYRMLQAPSRCLTGVRAEAGAPIVSDGALGKRPRRRRRGPSARSMPRNA